MFNITNLARILGLAVPKKLPFLRNGVQPVANVFSVPFGKIAIATAQLVVDAAGTDSASVTLPVAFGVGGKFRILECFVSSQTPTANVVATEAYVEIVINGSGFNFPFAVTNTSLQGRVCFDYSIYHEGAAVNFVVGSLTVTAANTLNCYVVVLHPDYWDLV